MKIVFIVTFLVFAIVLKDTVQRSQTLKNIAKDSKYVQSAHSASVKASQVFFKIAHYYDPTFNHRASLRICRRPNLSGKCKFLFLDESYELWRACTRGSEHLKFTSATVFRITLQHLIYSLVSSSSILGFAHSIYVYPKVSIGTN